MDTRTFIIPVSNRNMVEEQIEKLNRRVNKLGLDPITIAWGKAYTDCQDNFLSTCDLSGPLSVSYEGWQFIATLQHLPTGDNIIRAISDEFVVPLEYRESGSACEHCRVKRYRKDTYVVRHESGLIHQVGSTCIKDFLGGNSPDNIMQRASFLGELISFMTGAGSQQGNNDEGIFPMVMFLAQTSAVIKDHGWLSKTKAQETGGTSTASRVQDNLRPPKNFKRSEVIDSDRKIAKEAAEWAENISDSDAEINEYLYNIRAIARSGMVGWRTMGYAASIVPSYDRETNAKKPVAVSNWVGTLKVRENFDLVLQKSNSGTSDYGTYFRYTFHDAHANILVWTASYDMGLTEGKPYQIRGTVKAHSEWKGVRRTEINRCEILTVYGDAK